jgi:hypothetical protein
MVKTASVRLLDSVFRISIMILERLAENENNRAYLARLYNLAIQTLTQCPNAFAFISVLIKKDPQVADLVYFDVSHFDRSIEDVKRSLQRIVKEDLGAFNPITECRSYLSVVKFPVMDTDIQILPFSTHQEMLEGMMSMPARPVRSEARKLSNVTHQQSGSFTQYGRIRSSSSVLGNTVFMSLKMAKDMKVKIDPSLFAEDAVGLEYEIDTFLKG